MSSRRVTADDLDHAASWLNAYGDYERPNDEAADATGDDVTTTMRLVADWLQREAASRREDAEVREIQDRIEKRTGKRVTTAQARAALRHAMAPESDRAAS